MIEETIKEFDELFKEVSIKMPRTYEYIKIFINDALEKQENLYQGYVEKAVADTKEEHKRELVEARIEEYSAYHEQEIERLTLNEEDLIAITSTCKLNGKEKAKAILMLQEER